MNTITIILVVAAAAILLPPVVTVILIIINPVWGWWGMYRYIPQHKATRERRMEEWKKWHIIDRLRYSVFFRAVRQQQHFRYVRFTYFASLFFLWGYPIFAIRHLLVWVWKQI